MISDAQKTSLWEFLERNVDNCLVSNFNVIDFLENRNLARPGDRVLTSGDAGLLPPGLLIGQLAQDPNKRLRVRLSADFERLEFLQVLRDQKTLKIKGTGALVIPKDIAQPSEAAND